MRTLVISDLHLGARSGTWVLEHSAVRSALRAELANVDRLVLLGDVLELRQGPLDGVLAVALPVLAELGKALRLGQEVVIAPGNHDDRLLARWRARRTLSSPPELESAVDWTAGEPLDALAGALAPASLRVRYPGLWLREDVYATHGHYLDRHITVPLLERLGAGVMERLISADDYEAVLAPMYDLIGVVANRGLSTGLGLQARVWRGLERGRQRRGGRHPGRLVPLAVGLLNRVGLGPLNADLSGAELRRAGLRAFDEVLCRLGVSARYVLFGHTHRAGPLPGDDQSEWASRTGAKMINAGSWVNSPEFVGSRPHVSPYRAGFAVLLDDQGEPEVINLLDGLQSPATDPPDRALRPGPG